MPGGPGTAPKCAWNDRARPTRAMLSRMLIMARSGTDRRTYARDGICVAPRHRLCADGVASCPCCISGLMCYPISRTAKFHHPEISRETGGRMQFQQLAICSSSRERRAHRAADIDHHHISRGEMPRNIAASCRNHRIVRHMPEHRPDFFPCRVSTFRGESCFERPQDLEIEIRPDSRHRFAHAVGVLWRTRRSMPFSMCRPSCPSLIHAAPKTRQSYRMANGGGIRRRTGIAADTTDRAAPVPTDRCLWWR